MTYNNFKEEVKPNTIITQLLSMLKKNSNIKIVKILKISRLLKYFMIKTLIGS